jgi:drug/metabolite transporter (DMT)-like permease
MHFSLLILTVPVLFTFLTYIFGMAWWTVWKEKPSGKSWGIAASLINNLVMISAFILHKRPLSDYQWEVLAIGIVGLIAFLWPDEEESEIDVSETYKIEPDDTEQYNNHS